MISAVYMGRAFDKCIPYVKVFSLIQRLAYPDSNEHVEEQEEADEGVDLVEGNARLIAELVQDSMPSHQLPNQGCLRAKSQD